jgi:valyl-tRNA synthetase
LIDRKAFAQMQTIIDVIGVIRNLRLQWNIKPNENLDALMVPADAETEQLLKANEGDLKRLGRLKDLTIDAKARPLKDAAMGLVGTNKIFVPLAGIVDLDAEKAKMTAEMAQKQKSVEGLSGRLSNEAFVSKAPEDIIAKERERLDSLKKEIAELQNILANLSI